MSPGGTGRRRLLLLAIAGVLAATIAGTASLSGLFDGLERDSLSARFSLNHPKRPTDIAIVAIDDRSFGELNLRWPFPRSLHGRVIERLHAAGAKQVVYDVQFTEQTTPTEDGALYNAIGDAGGAVLTTSESDGHGHTNVLGGDANLAQVGAVAAAANLTNTAGGIVTKYPYDVAGLRSAAVVTAARVRGRPPARASFPGGSAWIDYRGGPGTFPTFSFSRVLRGQVPRSAFAGKVVIVGATSPTLQDVHATPVGGSDLMAGPEVEANAIWTALHGNPLRSAPGWIAFISILLGAFAAPLAATRLGALRAAIAAIAVGAAYALGVQAAFDGGTILTVTYPLLALALGTAAMLAASYLSATERGRLLDLLVSRRTQQLHETQLEMVQRLAAAAESRDLETGRHIERIGYFSERMGLAAGMNTGKAHMLRFASAMHDLGKIGIPDRILLKPGKLDEAEWKVMKEHAAIGAAILAGSRSPLIQMAETIAGTHHEWWDGSGYPAGLAGEEIPLVGRICAICDVFDALTSKRPYKEAWTPRAALAEIRRLSGSHFDPRLVELFLGLAPELKLEPEFPPPENEELDLESLPPLVAEARVPAG